MVCSPTPAKLRFLKTYDLWQVRSRSTTPKTAVLGLGQVLLSSWLDCGHTQLSDVVIACMHELENMDEPRFDRADSVVEDQEKKLTVTDLGPAKNTGRSVCCYTRPLQQSLWLLVLMPEWKIHGT